MTFPFFTKDLQIHSISKIRAMDLEETWQKTRVLPTCVVSKIGNDLSLRVTAASNILLNFE